MGGPMHRRHQWIRAARLCVAVVVLGGVSVAGAAPGGVPLPLPAAPRPPTQAELFDPAAPGPAPHVPDLVVLPAWDVYLDSDDPAETMTDDLVAHVTAHDVPARAALRFGTVIMNRGPYSLELVAVPRPAPPGQASVVELSQCVGFTGPRLLGAPRACTKILPVGVTRWHQLHGHVHLEGFLRYRLLRDLRGRPDTSPQGTVASGQKNAFCLRDSVYDDHVPRLDTGWYRDCRATWPYVPASSPRQGVSPGWGNGDASGIPGQYLRVGKLTDGLYWLEVTVNAPEIRGMVDIREVTRANNTSYRKIRVSQGGTIATAL